MVPSPPTKPFIGRVQHVVGGDLREDRHTKQMIPGDGSDKNAGLKSPRFFVWCMGLKVWSEAEVSLLSGNFRG